MLDLTLLKVLKSRKEFSLITPMLPESGLDPMTDLLIKAFGRYYDTFEEHESIDIELFKARFMMWYTTWPEDRMQAALTIIRLLKDDVDEGTKNSLTADLLELGLCSRIHSAVQQFQEGTLEYPLAQLISSHVDQYKMQAGVKAASWDNTPLATLLQEDRDDSGVRWRLACLNACMRPLRPGDFGIVAARPDKGKTTFLASELSFMARYLPIEKNIVWLNNEGLSRNIRKRVFMAALGCNLEQLMQKSDAGTAEQEYIETVGRMDKIRIFDVHDMHIGQVECILEQNAPGIVVYDMIDNIKGFGAEPRTDLQLERMYQWARQVAVKYNCIGLATSQISGDGEGEMYPPMHMLKDSKTGKQGACDFQLMIGHSNSELLKNSRFVSLVKNKLRRDGSPGDPRTEVLYDTERARYTDITPHQA